VVLFLLYLWLQVLAEKVIRAAPLTDSVPQRSRRSSPRFSCSLLRPPFFTFSLQSPECPLFLMILCRPLPVDDWEVPLSTKSPEKPSHTPINPISPSPNLSPISDHRVSPFRTCCSRYCLADALCAPIIDLPSRFFFF